MTTARKTRNKRQPRRIKAIDVNPWHNAPSETWLHKELVQWLIGHPEHGKTFLFLHPALEGKRSPQYRKLLKEMGCFPGDPDFVFFFSGHKFLGVELKRAKGTPTDSQIIRHGQYESINSPVSIIRTSSFYEAKEQLCSMTGLPNY